MCGEVLPHYSIEETFEKRIQTGWRNNFEIYDALVKGSFL